MLESHSSLLGACHPRAHTDLQVQTNAAIPLPRRHPSVHEYALIRSWRQRHKSWGSHFPSCSSSLGFCQQSLDCSVPTLQSRKWMNTTLCHPQGPCIMPWQRRATCLPPGLMTSAFAVGLPSLLASATLGLIVVSLLKLPWLGNGLMRLSGSGDAWDGVSNCEQGCPLAPLVFKWGPSSPYLSPRS